MRPAGAAHAEGARGPSESDAHVPLPRLPAAEPQVAVCARSGARGDCGAQREPLPHVHDRG